jgi:hypothetical protein
MFLRSRQRGDGKLGCILWTVILALVILIAWKAIPVKIKSAELYDFMVEQAKFAANAKPETIKKRILRRAKELDLPLDAKAVTVERIGDRIRMKARYTVNLEFPGYTYVWDFNHVVDRPIYIF